MLERVLIIIIISLQVWIATHVGILHVNVHVFMFRFVSAFRCTSTAFACSWCLVPACLLKTRASRGRVSK